MYRSGVLLLIVLAVGLSSSARGQISPVWAKFHVVSALDSLDDSDRDGITAANESAFGTNPKLRDPEPLLRWTGQGLEWSSVLGIRYQVELSDDLKTWLGQGEVIAGTNETLSVVVAQGRSRFARLRAVPPLDSDGDKLNDYEESLLKTNPSKADTDADGVSDFDEFAVGTDPLSPGGQIPVTGGFSSVAAGLAQTLVLKPDGSVWGGGLFYWDNDWAKFGEIFPKGFDRWQGIQAGDGAGYLLATDGTVWAWGLNQDGQLGLGSQEFFVFTPTRIPGGPWIHFAAGFRHVVAVDGTGRLWAWGHGLGKLGQNDQEERRVPTQIGTDSDWVQAAAGGSHSLAIKKGGTLWGWGQLGLITQEASLQPSRIPGEDWSAVAAGSEHTLALKKDGFLWAWGGNARGQLGDGTRVIRRAPKQIGRDTDWLSIGARGDSSFARKRDGSLFVWGWNDWGQVGDGTAADIRMEPTKIAGGPYREVACGGEHGIGIQADGSLWIWGRTTHAGIGSLAKNHGPVALRPDLRLSSVMTGEKASLALAEDGTLYGWGLNDGAELGDGTRVRRIAPTICAKDHRFIQTAFGSNHGLGLKANGEIWGWGIGASGQLARQTLSGFANPIQIGTALDWSQIFAGGHNSFAINQKGELWVWGGNFNGTLGIGNTTPLVITPVLLESEIPWASISARTDLTAGLKADGSLWTWGANGAGALGDGTREARSNPGRVGTDSDWSHVAIGTMHMIATRKDGSLWAWGDNGGGQLGLGDRLQQLSPTRVGTATGWSKVFARNQDSYAIKTDGSLWAWGATTTRFLENRDSLTLSPIQILPGTKWKDISIGTSGGLDMGNRATLGIQQDGSLWVWGTNNPIYLGNATVSPFQIGADKDWGVR